MLLVRFWKREYATEESRIEFFSETRAQRRKTATRSFRPDTRDMTVLSFIMLLSYKSVRVPIGYYSGRGVAGPLLKVELRVCN